MATSTLTTSYDDMVSSIGYTLGYGRTAGSWTAEQAADVAASLKSGLRRVYNAYDWSFLRVTSTLTCWATITGTINTAVHAAGSTTITATASVFYPTCVGQTLVDDSTDNGYVITGYTSGTVVVVSGNASSETGTFTITANGDYRLPDNYGWLNGPLHQESYAPLIPVGPQDLLDMRARTDASGTASWYATKWASSTNATDQRCDLMLYPTPSALTVYTYRYRVHPDLLVVTSAEYPFGGMQNAELIRVACMAAAEEEILGQPGIHSQRYPALLAEAIARDGMQEPDSLGVMGEAPASYIYERAQGVTYNGVAP